MSIDFSNLGMWFDLAQTLAVVALWLRKPGEDASQKVVELSQQATKLNGRVDVMEERVKHMPTAAKLSELESEVSGISAQLAGIEDTAKTTRATVQRIEDFLRENR